MNKNATMNMNVDKKSKIHWLMNEAANSEEHTQNI